MKSYVVTIAYKLISQVETVAAVGPLTLNKDFISRFSTSMQTNGDFYTDNNCFGIHKRQANMSSEFDDIKIHLNLF